MRTIITLTTDFGTDDGFVGSVKGVILSINPGVSIVDISHTVNPYDILGGAFVLYQAYSYFPENTIHIAVVDPGVGSKRQAIIIETDKHTFVGPDNGIFSLVLKNERPKRIISLTNEEYFSNDVSNTFHGRDIFAPVAARLALGEAVSNVGDELEKIEIADWGEPQCMEDRLEGTVLHIDRFGNLITNILTEDILSFSKESSIQIHVGEKTIKGLSKTYSDGKKGEPIALIGSSNLLEIACNMDSAQKNTGINKLGKVVVERIC